MIYFLVTSIILGILGIGSMYGIWYRISPKLDDVLFKSTIVILLLFIIVVAYCYIASLFLR